MLENAKHVPPRQSFPPNTPKSVAVHNFYNHSRILLCNVPQSLTLHEALCDSVQKVQPGGAWDLAPGDHR